jgi:hypothetical protein
MAKEFKIQLQYPADQIINKINNAATKHGIDFEGNEHSGNFSGKGVNGSYKTLGQQMIITIDKKPAIIPWTVVEEMIVSFFNN